MKNLQTSTPTRLAATLAVVAGLLTAAFWPAGPLGLQDAVRSATAHRFGQDNHIDPAIPALTIVAKKLNAADKRQIAQEDRLVRNIGMLTVNGDAARRMQPDDAY